MITPRHDTKQMRCPTCEGLFFPHESAALPFCCTRCKQIDMAKWLGEDYSVPDRPLDPDELEGLDDFPPE